MGKAASPQRALRWTEAPEAPAAVPFLVERSGGPDGSKVSHMSGNETGECNVVGGSNLTCSQCREKGVEMQAPLRLTPPVFGCIMENRDHQALEVPVEDVPAGKKQDPACVQCGTTEMSAPLLEFRFRGETGWICSACLPILIHQPEKIGAGLPGAADIPRPPHGHRT